MRSLSNSLRYGAFTLASLSMLALPSFAQSVAEPLDLTILSTNEENVQFVVIDEKKIVPEDASTDNASPEELTPEDVAPEDVNADNLTFDNLSLTDVNEAGDNESQSAPIVNQDALTAQLPETITDNTSIVADQPLEEEEAPKATRIERRTIKDVGLASIGVDQPEEGLDNFDSLLWRGLSVEKALRMIKAVPVSQSSATLRRTSYQVIARQAVPPKGAAEDPMMLLDARMGFLARAGRSDGLSQIIRQLPEKEEWQSWREWQIFYDLMMREDEAACNQAAEKVTTSLDPLWQKTNLLCQILTGNEAMASFSSDVLKASGLVEDDLFFQLIDVLLGRKEGIELAANEPVSLMNLILMDAAHIDISAAQIEGIDQSYAKAANALRYLTDEARQMHGLANLRAGLLTSNEAKAVFLASMGNVDDPLKAMTRRLEEASDLSSVQLYLALHRAAADEAAKATLDNDVIADDANDNETAIKPPVSSDLPEMVAQAFGQELKDGDGLLWLPFYASVMAEALAGADMTTLSSDLQKQYAILSALAGADLSPLPVDGQAVILADQIKILNDAQASQANRQEALFALGLDDLLILLEANNAGANNQADWFTLYFDGDLEEANKSLSNYHALPQMGLKAVEAAAARGQQAEAILLATILIAEHDLAMIAPRDISLVVKALSGAGLELTAKGLAAEALKAHSLAKLARYFEGQI